MKMLIVVFVFFAGLAFLYADGEKLDTGFDALTHNAGMLNRDRVSAPGNPAGHQTHNDLPSLSRTVYLYEEIETGLFPPSGWSVINGHANPNSNWHLAGDAANHYAETYYTDELMCDEWLISPTFSLPQASNLFLSFWFASRYYYMCVHDGADLFVKISTDNGTSWTTLWRENDFGLFNDETWYNVVLPISAYSGSSSTKIAFNYVGDEGDWIIVDQAGVFDATAFTLSMLDPLPDGSGTVIPAPGDHQYFQNSTAYLYATPSLGYTFNQWLQGNISPATQANTSFVMDSDRVVQAGFSPYGLELLVHQYGQGDYFWSSVNAPQESYEFADNFERPDLATIDKLVVHGFTLNYDYFDGWQNWVPGATERFIVSFYDEAPSSEPLWFNPVREEIVYGRMYLEGLVWDQYYLWKVELDLSSPLALNSGWVSTRIDQANGAGGAFQHLKANQGSIDAFAFQRHNLTPYQIDGDILLELWGSVADLPLATPVVSIQRSDQQITLSWPLVDGANEYQVYASELPDPQDWGAPLAILPGSQTQYSTDSLLRSGFFQVIASP